MEFPMSRITLDQARAVIAAAMAEGKTLGLAPLTVAVLDAGAHLIALERQDGSGIVRPQLAIAKAAGALGLGVSSRKIGEMAAERPTFIATLATISPNGVAPAAGGVIVVDASGAVIGAVGASGDLSDKDELCVLAGLKAAGLTAQA
jgi:uncharacterized protein GlcG (DUF336 family)